MKTSPRAKLRNKADAMKVAIFNIAKILSGDIASPVAVGDTIVIDDGKIATVGTGGNVDACDVAIDAGGMMAMPGLIDSHVHITFGDYTPRQKTVGFSKATFTAASPPASARRRCTCPAGRAIRPASRRWRSPRANRSSITGRAACAFMPARLSSNRVSATADFAEMAAQGVWLAKAGFGAFATPYEYAPYVAMAKQHGMITMVHTGGSSIPGSAGIWADHVLKMQPHVSYHVNGGPIAMPDADFPAAGQRERHRDAGLHRGQSAHDVARREIAANRPAKKNGFLSPPTRRPARGVMPLGMLYTMSHLAALAGVPPEIAVAMATGNNAKIYRLNAGFIAAGRDADIVLVDACLGGSQNDALSALQQRRHPGRWRGHHQWRAALRRTQPQHAGDGPQSQGGAVARAAEFLRRSALSARQPYRKSSTAVSASTASGMLWRSERARSSAVCVACR